MFVPTTSPLIKIAAIIFFLVTTAQAQNVAINATGTNADASAMLDVASTTRGMLVPRMTSTQRNGIANPATGLLVYDTSTGGFWFYDGSSWIELINSTNQDNLGNHTATTDLDIQANSLLFTDPENANNTVEFSASDAVSSDDGLAIRTHTNPANGEPIFRVMSSGSSERLRVEHNGDLSTTNTLEVLGTGDSDIAGNLGIGVTAPSQKLDVDGQIRMRQGNPGTGKVLTDSDGNGTAEWTDLKDNIAYTRFNNANLYPNNDDWQDVTSAQSLSVTTGDLLTLQAQAVVRLVSGAGTDQFQIRVSITGCATATSNVAELMPSENTADHNNHNPFPYLNYYDVPCTGTLSMTLQIRNTGDDIWEAKDRVLIVKKY